MSLREQILQAQDIKSEDVHVPEWGVTLRVQAMTGRQRAQLLQTAIRPDGKVDLVKLYPESIISCVVDPESGKPVFEPADRDALNLKSGAALERVAQAIMRLSGLSSDAIGDLEKNLSAASE